MEVETPEEAEAKVEDMLKKVLADNLTLSTFLVRAIQGKAYLPGSEDDINDGEHEN